VRTPRRRPLQRIGELLPALASRLGLEEELRGARAITTWDRVVAEHAPAAAGACRLVELRLRSSALLEAFARAPGGAHLLELTVIVRPARPGLSGQPR
jgi:hypothetical protein